VDDLEHLGYLPVENAGTLGLELSAADAKLAIVSLVAPNSPASHAGIQPGDQITKVNGLPVLDRAAATQMMFGKAGDTVNLTIKRGDAENVIPLKLARRLLASAS
jgi:carboxyl-terminal processing protease